MYTLLAALWQQGRLTRTQLDTAVTREWITTDQEQTMLAAPPDATASTA